MGDPVRDTPAADGWQMRIWPHRDAGPLAAVMAELIDWLVTEGYAATTQRNLVRAAARLGSWLDASPKMVVTCPPSGPPGCHAAGVRVTW